MVETPSTFGAASWWDSTPAWLASLKNLVLPRLEYARRHAITFDGLDVLDVGCGGGYMSEALARQGARVVGVDVDPAVLTQARAHAEASGLDIAYRPVGEGGRLPLPDASVDRVVCVDVLEHIPDPAATVAEIGRVLKPGGIFLYDTLDRTLLSRVVLIWLGEDVLGLVPRGIHPWSQCIRPSELEAMLGRAGLTPVARTGIIPSGISRGRVLTFALAPLSGGQYIGHAVKPAGE